jgi:hypothetical protein
MSGSYTSTRVIKGSAVLCHASRNKESIADQVFCSIEDRRSNLWKKMDSSRAM